MRHIIINVGRQLGSGGHDIGRMLALDFQAKYYDKEIMNLAAKESGFCEKFFEQNDEKKGFFKGLFRVSSSSKATLSKRQPRRDHVCLWAVVPTMCCATFPIR